MFEPSDKPRFFALPLGCDFLVELKRGLLERLEGQPAEALAQVEIYVNTRRTERRLKELFTSSVPTFLPRIKVIPDLANDPTAPIDLPIPTSSLKRRLILAQLTRALLKKTPGLAPVSAAFDLADSLASLIDEMHGEGVSFDAIANLDVAEHSEHWKRSKEFLEIVAQYTDKHALTDPNERLRSVANSYSKHWETSPPKHPIIIAGSTGSRGETAAFMKAVASLPQGAVVLPGVDFDMPEWILDEFPTSKVTLDHPQAGFHKLLGSMGMHLSELKPWITVNSVCNERNRLISLALRPAPFTDQWLQEGPALEDSINTATENVDLIEASGPKQEALSIAIRLRKAAEDDQRAVLISPDRNLTRRVEATLSRWGILADDSAGLPLHLSAPGVFLRLIANVLGQPLSPENFVALLKHPLSFSTDEIRGQHMLNTARIELAQLRGGNPVVNFDDILSWATEQNSSIELVPWANQIQSIFQSLNNSEPRSLAEWLQLHLKAANQLASGSNDGSSGTLWEKQSGKEAAAVMEKIQTEAEFGGEMTAFDYQNLFRHVLSNSEVREPRAAHPLISIWGTLEARVQGANLVILGGLNEGTWPKVPTPDPWLNRSMREQLDLLLPERNIGLSAHDFQQAISAPNVVLSRAIRNGEAPTMPSRWVVRLLNLLNGLGDKGKSSIKEMKDRGQYWVELCNLLDKPSEQDRCENFRAPRPAPSPPIASRPRKLWVTQITTLVRDPYSIYARHILNLNPLKELAPKPDALIRGSIFHKIAETCCSQIEPVTKSTFLSVAKNVLDTYAPWPSARALWMGKAESISDWFINLEQHDRLRRLSVFTELKGELDLKEVDFILAARTDRIDVTPNGLTIFDYKTGAAPTIAQVLKFDRQLPLTALIAEGAGFDKIVAQSVDKIQYISFSGGGKILEIPLTTKDGTNILEESFTSITSLIAAYQSPTLGYAARDRPEDIKYASDYDQLSRYGEWQDSDAPQTVILK